MLLKWRDARHSVVGFAAWYLLPLAAILQLAAGGLVFASGRVGYLASGPGIALFTLLESLLSAGFIGWIVCLLRRQAVARKQADEQADELHQRYRHIFQSSPLALCVSTPAEGRILDVNRSFLHLFGYQRDEVVGCTGAELDLWLSAQDRLELMAKLEQKPQIYNLECPFRARNGDFYSTLVAIDRIEIHKQEYLLWIVNDITKLRRHEEKIRDLIQLLNEAQDAICVRDLEDRIQYWNSGAERLFGWTAEEVLGHPIADRLYPDISIYEKAKTALLKNDKWEGEVHLRHRDGHTVVANSRWTLALDHQGHPKSILTLYTDITEKKQAEERYLRAQRMESIGTLAGGIAHDLNNVLAPILMSVYFLKGKVTDDDSRDMIAILETSAQRGASIIKQLLTFARGLDAPRVALRLDTLLKEMAQLMRETFAKSIQVRVDYPGSLWTIIGDVTQFQQVLLNLCVNARDAMPGGGQITLKAENLQVDETQVRTTPEACPGNYVMVSVADTGMGIKPDHLDKIFDPFFTTKEIGKGTGLGLSVALGIVKSHGGFIQVESELGRGTTFRVCLPASDANADRNSMAPPEAVPRGRGELILLVDDEAAIRAVTRRTLEKNGYRVLTAADGTEAVSCYTQHQSDIQVVLTDMMMPQMDGKATLRALRRINPAVRVIAVSGMLGEPSDPTEAPVSARLGKPFTANQLLLTVAKVLELPVHP